MSETEQMLYSRRNVSNRIRKAREYKKITQAQMANLLNISRQTYLDIEAGRIDAKVFSLLNIARITERSFAWFIYGENDAIDVQLAHKEQIDLLTNLLDSLEETSREFVINNALKLVEFMLNSEN